MRQRASRHLIAAYHPVETSTTPVPGIVPVLTVRIMALGTANFKWLASCLFSRQLNVRLLLSPPVALSPFSRRPRGRRLHSTPRYLISPLTSLEREAVTSRHGCIHEVRSPTHVACLFICIHGTRAEPRTPLGLVRLDAHAQYSVPHFNVSKTPAPRAGTKRAADR